MSMKQTYFVQVWLEHPEFSKWIAEVKNDNTKYRCKVCHKMKKLSNMGEGALKVHEDTEVHKGNVKKIQNFFFEIQQVNIPE